MGEALLASLPFEVPVTAVVCFSQALAPLRQLRLGERAALLARVVELLEAVDRLSVTRIGGRRALELCRHPRKVGALPHRREATLEHRACARGEALVDADWPVAGALCDRLLEARSVGGGVRVGQKPEPDKGFRGGLHARSSPGVDLVRGSGLTQWRISA